MKKKPISEFLNECAEWHAFWLGVVRAWMPINIATLSDELRADVIDEYHYHLLGYWGMRFVKLVALVVIVSLIF